MKNCNNCGSRNFRVPGISRVTSVITISENDSEDFEVWDTMPGDVEFVEDSTVTCCDCGEEIRYSEWNK